MFHCHWRNFVCQEHDWHLNLTFQDNMLVFGSFCTSCDVFHEFHSSNIRGLSVCLFACPSVRPSVRLSDLVDFSRTMCSCCINLLFYFVVLIFYLILDIISWKKNQNKKQNTSVWLIETTVPTSKSIHPSIWYLVQLDLLQLLCIAIAEKACMFYTWAVKWCADITLTISGVGNSLLQMSFNW